MIPESFLSALEDYVEAKIDIARQEAEGQYPGYEYDRAQCAKRRMLAALLDSDE
jgi:hypothetical protein